MAVTQAQIAAPLDRATPQVHALVQPNAGEPVHGKACLLFAIRMPIYRMVMKETR